MEGVRSTFDVGSVIPGMRAGVTMSTDAGLLFTPIAIGKLTIGGRLIKTATAETRASDDGFVTPEVLDFYRPLAIGGTPLIITGNLYVSRDGKSTPRQLGADADDKIPGLAALAAAVHGHGSRLFAQLNHCGRQVIPSFAEIAEAVSASDKTDLTTGTRPRPLALAEIECIVEHYAQAAQRCKQAGFDGVQVHAAHGYLLNQFLTPYTNRRSDAYGGSLAGRVRMLCEVIRAIRSRVGRDYPLIVKLNGSDALWLRSGLKTAALVEIAGILEREGIDAIEVSVGQLRVRLSHGPGKIRTVSAQHGAGKRAPPALRQARGHADVMAGPRDRVRSHLAPARGLQPRLHTRLQSEAFDPGDLRRGLSHSAGDAGGHRSRILRHRVGGARVHRRSAALSPSAQR